MKTIVLMQPYIFPHLPYYQLFQAADIFVFYDDAQYMKGGWINRNRILLNGKPHFITFPVQKKTLGTIIAESSFKDDIVRWKAKILRTMEQAYSKAPYFESAFPLIKNICEYDETNVARFAEHSIIEIVNYLDINVETRRSSELKTDSSQAGQDRVIAVVQALGGQTYVNTIGGMELYSPHNFATRNIELRFLKSSSETYTQFTDEFIPGLSIIDNLMFNSIEEISKQLGQFELIRKGQEESPAHTSIRQDNQPETGDSV